MSLLEQINKKRKEIKTDGFQCPLNWANASNWSAKVYIASRLGSTPELVANADATRGWVEIGKRF